MSKSRKNRVATTTARTRTRQAPVTVYQDVQARILSLLSRRANWNGTMTELNSAITTGLRRSVPSNWPSTPSVLRRVVNRVLPALRKAGVRVQFSRSTDHARRRFVSFIKN